MTSFNSSYLFGDDTLSGWGPRYFFSFYSEFSEDRSNVLFEISTFSVIFVLSMIANLAIAAALLRYPEMRTVNNCFLLNLTAADLAFVASIPPLIYARLSSQWTLGNTICKLLPYSQFVCGFVLLWTLTWISMDRHHLIVVPPFRSQLTPQRATVLTVITWFIALILFLPVTRWFRIQAVEGGYDICTLVFPTHEHVNVSLLFTVLTLLLSSITPLSLFVYHYQQIFRKLNETRSRWKPGEDKYVVQKPDLLRQQEEARLKRHWRVVRVLLLTVLVVLLMWLPITVIMFLIYVDGRRENEDTHFFLRSHHFIWALQIALLNTVVNPLLYGVLSESFRKVFLRSWFSAKRKKAISREVYDGPAVIGGSSRGPLQYTNSISIVD